MSNLAGTTWLFKDTPSLTSCGCSATGNLFFTGISNNISILVNSSTIYYTTITDVEELVYDTSFDGWQGNALKIISFIAEPTTFTPNENTFIAWLEANATKQKKEFVDIIDAKILYDDLREKIDTKSEIDDTAGNGVTDKTWSADKIYDQLALKANITSPTLKGTPKSVTPTSSSDAKMIATKEYVDNSFATQDAMLYKGVVNSNSELPTTHKQGWTYKVGTAGTYAGVNCEVGDMIICNTDGTAADDTHWNVIQTNIDGAVIGPASSTNSRIALFDGTTGKLLKQSSYTAGAAAAKGVDSDFDNTSSTNLPTTAAVATQLAAKVSGPSSAVNARVAVFDGTTGKLIKDSGYTIAKSVPSAAVFTDTTYTFANGTNGFTVTPAGGSAQTVTVTPSISAATSSANGLMPKADKAKLDGMAMVTYGTCTTAADAAAKEVAISNTNWQLKTGSIVGVRYTNTNTASNCTLDVNSTGAKSIYYNDAVYTSTSSTVCGYANRLTYYMYDGTYWVWLNFSSESDTNTLLRVYTQNTGYNGDYPILVGRTAASTLTAKDNGANTNVYGIIYKTNAPTVNPSTGDVKVQNLVVNGGSITIGNTTLSEAQLQYLLSLASASGISF